MTRRSEYTIAAAVAAVVGLGLILLSELGGVDQARVFGAALITVGGIGLGVLAGLGEVRPGQWLGRLRAQRVALGMALAVVLVLPVLAGLVGALVGLASAGGNGAVVATGAVIALLMLAGTGGALGMSIQAIRQAGRGAADRVVEAGEEECA